MGEEQKLEKKLSTTSVWALAFGCIIGWGAFVMPGDTFLMDAGPLGTVIGMILAIVVMSLISVNYNYMVRLYPVAGGEFKYTQMIFGDGHAYFCSWFLSLAYIMPIAMNATALALIGRTLLNSVFRIGPHYSVAGYEVYAGEIALAVSVSCLLGILCIKGVNMAGNFQILLTVMLVLGVVVIAAASIVSPKASVDNMRPFFSSETSKIAGIFSIVTMAPWAFFGFDTIPQVAEESNFSPKKTRTIMIASIMFGGGVYIILNTVTASVLPAGYSSWIEYIREAKQLEGLEALPTFYAAYELLGKAGLLFIGVAVLAAVLSGIVGFYMAASRLLFSMSREEFLPKWFGVVDKKSKTPKNAIIFLMIITMVAPFFGRTALGWLVDMSCAGGAIGYFYTSLAAFKCARKAHSTNCMIIGGIGVVLSVLFAILLLVPVPGLNSVLGKEAYICLLIWTVLGVGFYAYMRMKKTDEPVEVVSLENAE